MKKQIKEVQNYFKGKLLKGDFEIIKVDQFYAYLTIDEEYSFNIWTACGANTIATKGACESSFIELEFSEAEKEAIWGNLKPTVENFKRNTLLKKKEAELEKLKKELDIA